MFASRIFRILLLALGVAALAQALHAPHQHDEREALVKRQRANPTVDADPTSSSPPPSSSPTDDPTDEPTKDPTPTDNPNTSTSNPPKTTTKPATPTDDPNEETTSKEPEPVTETHTEIVTTTNADGSVETKTSESTSTHTPGLSEENKSGGGSSGMSTSTRNTVIGVVVGVGGAIVLGALAFVAWRIWGKKKGPDPNDGLMNYNTGYAPMDKSEAGSSAGGPAAARNPFQSTLETYHAPTQVNASSNF